MRVQLQDRVAELQEVSIAAPFPLLSGCPSLMCTSVSFCPGCRKPKRLKRAKKNWP